MNAKASQSLDKIVVLGALALACSGKPGTTEFRGAGSGDEPNTDTTELGDPPSVLCNAGDENTEPEYYRLEPMNRKLGYYPELAQAIGTAHVSNCEGARTFLQGYYEYSLAHPDFDAEQPFEYPEVPLPTMPEEDSGSYETNKILNGMGAITNLPVVQLSWEPTITNDPNIEAQYSSFTGGSCTGTFISKNVILTAAHCVSDQAVDFCRQRKVTVQNCRPQWLQYSKWKIHFSNFELTNVGGVSDVHPDWFGRGFHPGTPFPASDTPGFPSDPQSTYRTVIGARHDIAVIYINEDARLPFNVELDGAKRLARHLPPVTGIDLTGPMTFYGWGDHPGTDHTLYKSLQLPQLSAGGDAIVGTIVDTHDSVVCSGDSGGPLVFPMDVVGNDGMQRTVEAIFGVASTGPGGTIRNKCPTTAPVGTSDMLWARVDTPNAQNFITRFMDRYYGPFFRCRDRTRVGGTPGTADMAECWGAPCREAADCKSQPTGYYCSAAGSLLNKKSCDTCATQGGGCGCVVGQCLPGQGATPPPPL